MFLEKPKDANFRNSHVIKVEREREGIGRGQGREGKEEGWVGMGEFTAPRRNKGLETGR